MKKNNILFSFLAMLAIATVTFGAVPLAVSADNPVPTTTSISPTNTPSGGQAFTLTVYGSNFIPGSVVNVNGSARTTTYVSSSQLTASMPASDSTTMGSLNVTVTNPAPGGGTSNAQTLVVGNAVPTIVSISPSSVNSGSGNTMITVNGTNFMPSSTITFNGSNRTATYVSPTQLTFTLNASDLNTPGSFNVSVGNPAPGGGTSLMQVFTVSGNNPVPLLSSISPSSMVAGSSNFTLTVYGSNFTSASKIRFNGIPRTTTFVSPTQLTAAFTSADAAVTGNYLVDVFTPTPGGGSSNSTLFTVSPISSTPVLPDTGFGQSGFGNQWQGFLAALGAMIATLMITIQTKHLWLKKQ